MEGTWRASDWESFLGERLGVRVHVVFGRSASYPIQVRHVDAPARGLAVRMHGVFAGCEPPIAEAVASWIRSGRRARRACAELDAWIERSLAELPPSAARRTRHVVLGHHHDLRALAETLFAGELRVDFARERERPDLTWGRRGRSRSRRSLRLGSYDPDTRLVRVHAVLDQPAVPDWFVRYIVFHELLHAILPPRRGTGERWIHHGTEFRRRERLYHDYTRALTWEAANLPRLIASARRGTPLRNRREPAIPRLVQGRLFVD